MKATPEKNDIFVIFDHLLSQFIATIHRFALFLSLRDGPSKLGLLAKSEAIYSR
jgi:hypothetical protein